MRKLLGVLCAGVVALAAPSGQAAERLPITDTHLHYSHDAWEVYPTDAAIALLKEAGLKLAFVSSSSDEGTQRLYKAAPDLVVPVLRPYRRRGELATWMHDDTRVAMLTDLLAKNHYAGIGEFHAFGDDIRTDVLRGVIRLANKYDVFLHAHSDAAAIDLIFEEDPEAIVLWAHSGFVPPSQVAEMLRKHKNLWADLAFRSEQGQNGEVPADWRAAFAEFPERFMLGTDTYTPERWPAIALTLAAIMPGPAAADPCASITEGAMRLAAEDGAGEVLAVPDPAPLRTGRQFALKLTLCGDTGGWSVRKVDAWMPLHQHGMNYRARVSAAEGEGRYRAEGMLLHMPGRWRFAVETEQAGARIVYTTDVTVMP